MWTNYTQLRPKTAKSSKTKPSSSLSFSLLLDVASEQKIQTVLERPMDIAYCALKAKRRMSHVEPFRLKKFSRRGKNRNSDRLDDTASPIFSFLLRSGRLSPQNLNLKAFYFFLCGFRMESRTFFRNRWMRFLTSIPGGSTSKGNGSL